MDDNTAKFFAHIGRNGMPVVKALGSHLERCFGIEDDEVRVVSGRDLALDPVDAGAEAS